MSIPENIAKNIKNIDDIASLFPRSPQEIENRAEHYIAQTQKELDAILAIPHEQRTFENTAGAIDRLSSVSDLDVWHNILGVVEYTHPDKELRDSAHNTALKISDFWIDAVNNNKQLYETFKAYTQGNAKNETLDDEQRYYLEETMKGLKRAGLDLPDEQRKKVGALKKELAQLGMEFSRNIAEDQSSVTVSNQDLVGLDQEFIDNLNKNEDGRIILGVDYPTYFTVMDQCEVENTRKQLYKLFNNRAHPKNTDLLKKIIAKRDELARMLEYKSYAHLDTEEQMVKTPQRAQEFLNDLIKRSAAKEDAEIAQLKKQLPPSVTLAKSGKFKPWDLRFVQTQYKKNHLAVDEQAIAQYFPMQHTINELLDIYTQFLGVKFKEQPATGLWHEDVRMISVYSDNDKILGYLMLDLHPRPNKYQHACHAGIITGVLDEIPVVSLVIANFPKPTATKPSLLKRNEVETFFHEFGHAIHALLGVTKMRSFAGTSVKRDFVEMPSQMLEEWLWDKEILQKVSSHYTTNEKLPNEMIDKILAVKQFDSGYFIQRQSWLALISLLLFKEGADKDPITIQHDLAKKYIRHSELDPDNHFVASFGHLTGYGAKYYGYLWSKVFALDMFEQIKEKGLLNSQMGKHYIKTVIGRGGSADPNQLLRDFLSREPQMDAFLADMGLEVN